MTPLAYFVIVFTLTRNVADGAIGIDWGRQTAQRLLPSNVVDLLLQNGIRQARLFTTEMDMLKAFKGSEIELTLSVDSSAVGTPEKAKEWVEMRNGYLNPANIRQILIADYVFSSGIKGPIGDAIRSLQYLQKALNDALYGDHIKVTIIHIETVVKMNNATLRPSDAEFRDDIRQEMATLVNIIQQNNATFLISITPMMFIQRYDLDINFAMFDNKSSFSVTDVNGYKYTNAFELMFDAYIWCLKKINASDVRVKVGNIGWPTDGYPGANTTMAERFFKGLLPLVTSNKGTPMRPGAPIDITIHSLTDENKMVYVNSATFTRHSGIFRSNGKPKYKMDLSGQGRDIYPAEARGIMRMPGRWCVYTRRDPTNITNVMEQLNKACKSSDCTTLARGGSCSHLDFEQNVTYAFNMHFQFHYQNELECDFGGLGTVSTIDPSVPGCVFPVEVVKAHEAPYEFFTMKKGKGIRESPKCAIFVILMSIMWMILL